MKKKTSKRWILGFRVKESTYERIKEQAEIREVSMSDVLRDIFMGNITPPESSSITDALMTYPLIDNEIINLWQKEDQRGLLSAMAKMAKKRRGVNLKV